MAIDLQRSADSGRHSVAKPIVGRFASGALRYGPSSGSLHRRRIAADRRIGASDERAAGEHARRSDPPLSGHGKRKQTAHPLWWHSHRPAHLVIHC